MLPDWAVTEDAAARALKEHFGVATLEGFGIETGDASLRAAAGVLHYLNETQKQSLVHITALRRFHTGQHLLLDHSTRARLDLDALFTVLDFTATAAGARLLRDRLHLPLTNVEDITARHAAVEELAAGGFLRRDLRERLKGIRDIERIVSRAATRRASPRDLAGLRATLSIVPGVSEALREAKSDILQRIRVDLDPVPEVGELLAARSPRIRPRSCATAA